MRKLALSLVSSLLFIGTSSAEVYVGTDRLLGSVTASPHGSGGDTFELPVDFTLSITVDIVPFQSMTITDLTLTADPVALDFPGFNANVSLTIDELSLQWTDKEFDLNPASGGVFGTPTVASQLNGCIDWYCNPIVSAGRVDLKGKWDNYAFHKDLAADQDVARYYRDGGDYDMQIDPGNYPENLELGFSYYDYSNYYDSRHKYRRMFEADLSNVLLEPNYEWSEIAIYYPDAPGDGDTAYNLTLSPEVVPLLGDYNDNGTVDAADLDALYVVSDTTVPPTDPRFDLNSDNVIDTADLDQWLSLAATANGYSSPYLRGDTDLDRDIDLGDYNRLATNFDPSGTYGPYLWHHGNSDGDDDIDLADYNAVASNFQPLGYGAEAVPEPSAALLALLGMLLISVFSRLSVLK